MLDVRLAKVGNKVVLADRQDKDGEGTLRLVEESGGALVLLLQQIVICECGYTDAYNYSCLILPYSGGNENLRLSVLFFIIVMDSGSLKRSCARALTIAWLHIIRPLPCHAEFGDYPERCPSTSKPV
jgi:hypothetical protein